MWAGWLRTAAVCRHGHQDVYRILGRDPFLEPLDPLESELFWRAVHQVTSDELSPKDAEPPQTMRIDADE